MRHVFVFFGLLFIVIGCSDFAPKKPLAVAGENGELLKESLAERDLCDIQQSRKLGCHYELQFY